MDDSADRRTFSLTLGTLDRDGIVAALRAADLHLNAHAVTLLDQFDPLDGAGQTLMLVDVAMADLGLTAGGSLTEVFSAAEAHGLALCPMPTAPYLRLAWSDQRQSADSVLSAGRAPEGAVTVASAPPSADDDDPKGFYLRVVDGVAWLRGYRCDDAHRWAATDRFVFCQAEAAPAQRVM